MRTSFLLVLGAALLLFAPDSPVIAANATVPPKPIRGEVIINRTNAAWESQQVQEPCILPNPKDPTRLMMFYSGVPATNQNLCFIGKPGWDSGSIRLDAVLYLAEEDAYYMTG